MNLIGDGSEKLFHVGYFPLVMHQSNTELRQLLEARGVGTVKAKDELIKIITKKLGWMFIEGTLNLKRHNRIECKWGQQMVLGRREENI